MGEDFGDAVCILICLLGVILLGLVGYFGWQDTEHWAIAAFAWSFAGFYVLLAAYFVWGIQKRGKDRDRRPRGGPPT